MTAVAERPITDTAAERYTSFEAPAGLKAELLRGEIVMMAGPTGSTT